jgi:putative membrane-bound dehydrogenase-like protein
MKQLIAFLLVAFAASTTSPAADPKPDAAAKRPASKRGADVAVAPFDAAKIVPQAVAVEHLKLPDDLEVTVWATTPMLFNPTNMDTDAAGRIWIAEGVNYRKHETRRAEGDRIVVLEDSDGDGRADKSHCFVQEKGLIAPLGVSVFDNKIVVAQPPGIIVYTDVNRDLKFDPAVDTREEVLTGFNASNHDHSLHAVIAGPDGKWYFNQGNAGALIND